MPAPKGKDGLTALERRCIEAFVGTANNQVEAYRIATGTKANGSTAKKQAWKIFKRPHVAAEVGRRQTTITEMAVERAAIDKAWVMERLEKVVERCLPGDGTAGFNAAGANRALELLGKELGMFVDRSEADVNVAFTDMTDERIESRLAELLRKAGAAQPAGGKGAPGRKV